VDNFVANKYAKNHLVGVYICQSAPGVFNWMTHICVIPHPVHLNVWRIYESIRAEGVLNTQPNQEVDTLPMNLCVIGTKNTLQLSLSTSCMYFIQFCNTQHST